MATILVVDDDHQIRELVRIALRRIGHRVLTAGSGHEALGRARSDRPDLILLDLVMPEMSGQQVLEQLRADPALRGIPVVLTTGELEGRVELKVAAVLGKPFRLDRLYAAVGNLLGEPGSASVA